MLQAALPWVLFVALAAAVAGGWTQGFDEAGLRLIDPAAGGAISIEVARDLTALGSNDVLGLLVVGLVGLMALQRRAADAWLLIACFSGGLALVALVKDCIARPRPELAGQAVRVFTSSFPSSHATMSAAIAVTALLLLDDGGTCRAIRTYAAWFAAGLVLLVGMSRVVLGVHWPSDVAAGWVLGPAWALSCRSAQSALNARGR